MTTTNYPLLMTEDYWMNTYLSIARHYGGIMLEGREYIIVDKLGRDLWECSAIAAREGRQKAIEPGEPADLILKSLKTAYSKLGRDRIIRLIGEGKTEKGIKDIAKQEKKLDNEQQKEHGQQLSIF